MSTFNCVAIAGSAGSLSVLDDIASEWPEQIPWPLVIVLHTSSKLEQKLKIHLSHLFNREVIEIYDNLAIEKDTIYLAPADYHSLLEDKKTFALCAGEKVCYARPSIDVFLESAGYIFREHMLAILLSGANKDGCHGCTRIHQLGGTVVVQDPKTAEAATMPKSAIVSNEVSFILNVAEIKLLIHELVNKHE